jgi:hypothetical protein
MKIYYLLLLLFLLNIYFFIELYEMNKKFIFMKTILKKPYK